MLGRHISSLQGLHYQGNKQLLFSPTNSSLFYVTASELGWTEVLIEPCDDKSSRQKQDKRNQHACMIGDRVVALIHSFIQTIQVLGPC